MKDDVLVIGSGPAGLATAGCLIQLGVPVRVIEKAGDVASSWRSHYERLRLHTVKTHSALPGMPFPEHYPQYVPRKEMVDYLASYAERFQINPHFGQQAMCISAVKEGWNTLTASGNSYVARNVVIATGANCFPHEPVFTNQSMFAGTIMHSHAYKNPVPFFGQRVLVVGMGNTGAEIALDLAEQGVLVALSVRSPLNIVYRDVLGRPTQLTALALARLPQSWGDAMSSLLRDLTVGDLRRWGIQTSPLSPMRQLREFGKTPLIDIGTLARIKRGEIKVHAGIDQFAEHSVRFVDGSEGHFDTVIFATGYEPQLNKLFPNHPVAVDFNGMPGDISGTGLNEGIHFVGFNIRAPGGLLRTIGVQARTVAGAIQRDIQPGIVRGVHNRA
jgi:indole-3-pyruvate monooxygenase